MKREKLEELSNEILIRRKKIATGIVITLVIIILLSIIIFVIQFMNGNELKFQKFAPVLCCLVCGLPIYAGIKKINEELKKRGNF